MAKQSRRQFGNWLFFTEKFVWSFLNERFHHANPANVAFFLLNGLICLSVGNLVVDLSNRLAQRWLEQFNSHFSSTLFHAHSVYPDKYCVCGIFLSLSFRSACSIQLCRKREHFFFSRKQIQFWLHKSMMSAKPKLACYVKAFVFCTRNCHIL